MKKPKSIHSTSPARKRMILRATLECFTERGYEATGIEDICSRAGVSVGSLYHHFKSKDMLAAQLYFQGIADYQKGLLGELGSAKNAKQGVLGSVRYHLNWVAQNADQARFLFQQRHAGFMEQSEDEFIKMNAEFFSGIALWMKAHVDSGDLQRMPPDVYVCMVLGPCQEYSRLFLSGRCMTPVDKAIRELGDAVWHALKAR